MRLNLRNILRYSITGILLLVLVSVADIRNITGRISQTDLGIYGIAVLVFSSIYLWSGLRWRSLTSGLGYSLGLNGSVKIIMMSYGFNKILPLNSGDLTRSKLMERYTDVDNHGKILGAVAMERFLDVLLLGALTGVSSLTLLNDSGSILWILLGAGLLISSMSLVRLKNKQVLELFDFIEELGAPVKIVNFMKDGVKGFSEIPNKKLGESLVWHLMRWAAGILTLYILALSLGTPVSLFGATLVTGVMSLVAALPITPAGLGPVEVLGTGTLVLIGLSTNQAAALVILQRSLGLVLMGGLGAVVYALD
jgi:uncharacterized protein (TIRG00374 family)